MLGIIAYEIHIIAMALFFLYGRIGLFFYIGGVMYMIKGKVNWSVLLGAAFLMATSSIGPGFLTPFVLKNKKAPS